MQIGTDPNYANQSRIYLKTKVFDLIDLLVTKCHQPAGLLTIYDTMVSDHSNELNQSFN